MSEQTKTTALGILIAIIFVFAFEACSKSDNRNSQSESIDSEPRVETLDSEPRVETLVGTYTTKGDYPNILTFKISERGKVVCETEIRYHYTGIHKETYYGSCKRHRDYYVISFDEGPVMHFNDFGESFLYIKDGYVYTSPVDMDAENPKKRFKFTKQ
jgi:hypothetical protein